ncbi:XK-related protein 8-like [Lepisosteus oculatus]|uniref:XK-related protein 8-like n=1 Tax=Lepisosteus oculatus TaxID=7918 RepID=UPI0035F51409
MECSQFSKYSWLDFFFTLLGVCTFLFDLGSDVWVAVDFFSRGDYVWFGATVAIIVVSSAVVQMFSWLWYRYDQQLENFRALTLTEDFLLRGRGRCCLNLLHIFQLGLFMRRKISGCTGRGRNAGVHGAVHCDTGTVTYYPVCCCSSPCRYITAIELGFQVWWKRKQGSEYAVYKTHDLSMLRLFETFFESTPQLTLMLYIIIRNNQASVVQCECGRVTAERKSGYNLDGFFPHSTKVSLYPPCLPPGISMAASFISIASGLRDYHHSLRSFLPEKAKMGYSSSVVYFLWNLLLIAPRVAAVAVFTSVFPRYLVLHFLALWLALFVWAWLQNTQFMDNAQGEWLYRAAVAFIWYFSWFNVADGKTRGRSVIYHSFMFVDSAILVATWGYYRDCVLTEAYAGPLFSVLSSAYLLGLLIKAFYYWFFHPKQRTFSPLSKKNVSESETLSGQDVPDTQAPSRDDVQYTMVRSTSTYICATSLLTSPRPHQDFLLFRGLTALPQQSEQDSSGPCN